VGFPTFELAPTSFFAVRVLSSLGHCRYVRPQGPSMPPSLPRPSPHPTVLHPGRPGYGPRENFSPSPVPERLAAFRFSFVFFRARDEVLLC